MRPGPTAVPRRLRRLLSPAVAVVLGISALTVISGGLPAQAAATVYAPSAGTATGTVASGSTATAPTVVTSGACPAGTMYLQAFLDGPGLTQGAAIASDSANLPNMNTTGVPFSFNLLAVATNKGAVLVNGTYALAVVCDPGFGAAYTQQYDGQITVTGGATPTSAGTTYTWTGAGSAKPTTTTVTTSPTGTAQPGQPVTLTATVSPAGAAGNVQFTDTTSGAPVDIGPAVTVPATGTAIYSPTALAAGTHTFGARFTPTDPKAFAPSTSSPAQLIVLGANQSATTTTLTADPAAGVVRGGTVTLTASVTPAAAAGTVSFTGNGTAITSATVSNGTATVTVQPAEFGTLRLAAAFTPSDSATYAPSTSAVLTYQVAEPFTEGPFVDDLVVMGPEVGTNEGVATQGIQLKAPQACPAPAAAVTVRISGPGGWALGIEVKATANAYFDAAGSSILTEPLATSAGRAGLQIIPGAYRFAVTCRVPFTNAATGFFLGRVWFYDGSNWMNQDPALVGIPTTTSLTIAPAGRAVVANKVELAATVTPADSAGSVVFEAVTGTTTVTIGTATIKAGRATLATSTLEIGLYYVTAAYTPDGTNRTKRNASTSPESVFAITKGSPPAPRSGLKATIAGTPKVGSTLTCSARFDDAASQSYQWFRDQAQIPGSGVTRTLVSADAGHRIRCRVTATNPGGTVYRDSDTVSVRG